MVTGAGNALARSNAMQLISYYRSAINSSTDPEEARALNESLQQVLSDNGISANEAGSVSNPLLDKPGAAKKQADGNQMANNGLKAQGNCKSCHGCGKCGKNEVKGQKMSIVA